MHLRMVATPHRVRRTGVCSAPRLRRMGWLETGLVVGLAPLFSSERGLKELIEVLTTDQVRCLIGSEENGLAARSGELKGVS